MLCADPARASPALTAVLMPGAEGADAFRGVVLDRFNMSVGQGLGKLSDNIFRIGYLGNFNDLMLCGTLAGVEMGLAAAGISIGRALVGEMLLDEGRANDGIQVLSADWIRQMLQPCALAPYYGFLIWLNHGQKVFPSVPASSYFGMGARSSFTWAEPERKIVVIVRWLNSAHADELFGKILKPVDETPT